MEEIPGGNKSRGLCWVTVISLANCVHVFFFFYQEVLEIPSILHKVDPKTRLAGR